MPTVSRSSLLVILGGLVITFVPTRTDAQSSQPGTDRGGFHGWQIEAHVGGMPSSTPTGAGALPPGGSTFTTVTGVPSRFVPSWYFGDGALLANQVSQAIVRNNPGLQLPQIVSLDSVLTTASATRQSGADFGFRIGHSVTRHVLVEFSADVAQGKMALTSEALSAIEATRASFKPYFDAILGVNPNAVAVSTSSMATIENDNTGFQIAGVLDVAISPGSYAGFTPYVTIGGGLLLPLPFDAPTATLIGTYAMTVNIPGTAINGARLNESDAVQVRYKVNPIPVFVLGGGVQRNVTAHTGFRADVRFYPKGNDMTIRLDTQPMSGIGVPSGRINRGPGPGLQFSTLPGIQSSLSPQATVTHFDTFTGHATEANITIGYFFRF